MKYKAFDKVIYCGEETQIIGINSLEKDIKYAVTVGDDRTVEWALEFELSPLEPEQLRQREQFFSDSEPDMVNHPPHYANKNPETINMIRAVLTEEEFIGGLKWQILKYRDRAHDKGNYEQDMAKAKFYYDLLQEVTEGRLSK